MDYSKMTNQEIDELVAVRIYGWKNVKYRDVMTDRRSYSPAGFYGDGPDFECYFEVGRWSKDLNNAIQAAEKWRAGDERRSWNLDSPCKAMMVEYCCQLDDGMPVKKEAPITVWDSTPARAICEALLKASE